MCLYLLSSTHVRSYYLSQPKGTTLLRRAEEHRYYATAARLSFLTEGGMKAGTGWLLRRVGLLPSGGRCRGCGFREGGQRRRWGIAKHYYGQLADTAQYVALREGITVFHLGAG